MGNLLFISYLFNYSWVVGGHWKCFVTVDLNITREGSLLADGKAGTEGLRAERLLRGL